MHRCEILIQVFSYHCWIHSKEEYFPECSSLNVAGISSWKTKEKPGGTVGFKITLNSCIHECHLYGITLLHRLIAEFMSEPSDVIPDLFSHLLFIRFCISVWGFYSKAHKSVRRCRTAKTNLTSRLFLHCSSEILAPAALSPRFLAHPLF